jgi:choline-sulfatase
MTRKDFLRLLSTIVPLSATSRLSAIGRAVSGPVSAAQHPPSVSNPKPGAEGKRRPNVLIIMTDQHRSDYMTAAGDSIVPTPNIDRIAARGVRFTNAVCPYPVCAASRMALLSGKYAHTTGVINNTDRLPWNTPTMASHLSGLGYNTGLIGKMHFNDAHSHGFNYFLGFNDYFMYLGPKVQFYADAIANATSPTFFKTVDDNGAGLPELPGVWGDKRPWAGQVKHLGLPSEFQDPDDEFDSFVARESIRFLERYEKDEEPFLLVSSFLRPHPPLHPPQQWADRYPLDTMQLPEIGDIAGYPQWIQKRIAQFTSLGPDRLRANRAGYLGNLAFVDTCVGQLYQALDRLGLAKDTIVIYTSDHGEMGGDHGLYGKFCLFEPSVRVPLIVSQPGRLPEGKTCDALVEYFGIFPTLAELTHSPTPTGIDAHSFAHLVHNPAASGPEAIFSEFNLRSQRDCYMVRTKRYKFIYNNNDIPELYDLEADPGERVNRGQDASFTRVRNELHSRLMAWYNPATNPYNKRHA